MSIYDFLSSIEGVEVLRETAAPLPRWTPLFFWSILLCSAVLCIFCRRFNIPFSALLTGSLLIGLIAMCWIVPWLISQPPAPKCYEISVAENADKKTLTEYFDIYPIDSGFTWAACKKESKELPTAPMLQH